MEHISINLTIKGFGCFFLNLKESNFIRDTKKLVRETTDGNTVAIFSPGDL